MKTATFPEEKMALNPLLLYHHCTIPQWAALLCFFTVIMSSVPFSSPSTVGSQEASLHHQRNSERIQRSPLRPPSVISFDPGVRRSNSKVFLVGSTSSVLPPQVSSQNETPHKSRLLEVIGTNSVVSLPSSPYFTSLKEPNIKGRTSQEIYHSALYVQNDQHSMELLQEKKGSGNAFHGQETHDKRAMSPDRLNAPTVLKSDNDDQYANSITQPRKMPKFADFRELLKAINMTNESLRKALEKKSITFTSFIDFAENGATADDIKKYLQPSREHKERNYINNERQFDTKIIGSRKEISKSSKMLTDLPFTAIVHDIPINQEDQFNVNLVENPKNKKFRKQNGIKKGEIAKQDFGNDPYDYSDSLLLPPKDSPIVAHFKPTRNDQKLVSASIISFSVEEKEKTQEEKPPLIPKVRNYNKPLSTKPLSKKVDPDPLLVNPYKTTYSKISKKAEPASKRPILQNNLRLIFPMKGVLIFCASLGGLAFVTITITIIYACIKYKKDKLNKKIPKSCKVSEEDVANA